MLKLEEFRDIRLLYVEDDEAASAAMVKIFKKFFQHIDIAYDGREGLEKILANNYDLIVTDINMPNLNGLDMIRGMKDAGKSIYTIMLTAYSDNNTFHESIKLGVQSYAIKPINVSQFVESLSTAVSTINNSKKIEALEQYENVMVSKTDCQGIITYVNDKFCEVSGYTKDELIGKNHSIMKHPQTSHEVFIDLWNTIKSRNIWVGKICNIKKDGTEYYLNTTICPIVDQSGDIIEYIGLRNDLSDMKDPKIELQNILKTTKKPFLAMLKTESFHTLEHIYTKEILEEMLETFYRMLYTYIPSGLKIDGIINLQKGIYALYFDFKSEDIPNAKTLGDLLSELQHNIEQSIIVVDEYDFDLSVLVSYSTDKTDIYANVEYGLDIVQEKNRSIICSDNLTTIAKEEAVKNTKTIKMIQNAITKGNIVSYFQPITNNKTGIVEKYESLVRLITDDGKVLSPFFFLDIAKESGYYIKITNIVLEKSFDALKKTTKEISINLSALDIENIYIRNKIIQLLKNNKDDTHRVVFELLEDEQVKDFNVVKDFITNVKSYGVQIAIDDFGAGVSNFERLLDYQPDILKIDACLIKNIDQDKYSKDVVETLQIFAWKQEIKTVAEFVETPEILKTVKDIGINYTQGYLLGKPDLLENHLKN